MKNLFLLLVLITLGCKQQQKKETLIEGYVIEGEVTNFKEGTMLYIDDPDTQTQIDSAKIVKGKFQFKGKMESPKRIFLSTKYDPQNENNHKYTSFWVDNGVITLKGDYNDFKFAKVEGLEIHEIDQELSKLIQPINRRMDSLSKLYNDDNENNRKISSEVNKSMQMSDSITVGFIKKNPNNYVSLSNVGYLADKFSKEELNTIYTALDQNLKESDPGKVLKQYMAIDKILEKGDHLADIEGKTLTGETMKLSEIAKQHKYTILDFWAAGCMPCRLQSKQYRVLYEQYKEKGLEIVSFSLDKNKENWEKASKKDSITWVNISDLKGNDGVAPMTYGVKGIPNSFLINEEGVIIAEFNYYHPEKAPFEKELQGFFESGGE